VAAERRRSGRQTPLLAVALVAALCGWLQPGAATAALIPAAARLFAPPVERSTARDAPSKQPGRYVVYRNQRFGQTVEYPTDLFTESQDLEDGAGRKFVTADGAATLYASGARNDAGWNVRDLARLSESYFADKGAEVTFVRTGDNWYVLSATDDNGRVHYEKGLVTHQGRIVSTLLVEYPAAWKDYFQPILSRIVHSFQSGPAEGVG
jgi:hypothetical protein